MKKLKQFALAIIALTVVSCSGDKKETSVEDLSDAATEAASAPATSGKYQIKSGTIHFETTAGDMKNKKVVHFDDYGSKERVELYQDDGALKDYTTSDGKTRYFIDIPNKTAWIADQNGSLGWEMKFQSWSEIERSGNRDNDFKRVDNVTIVGKDCEAYEFRDMAVFAGWKGLTLYHKQKPNILTRAVKLEENVEHDPSVFAVPEDFEVKERPTYN